MSASPCRWRFSVVVLAGGDLLNGRKGAVDAGNTLHVLLNLKI